VINSGTQGPTWPLTSTPRVRTGPMLLRHDSNIFGYNSGLVREAAGRRVWRLRKVAHV
jgi:hypothetical protein